MVGARPSVAAVDGVLAAVLVRDRARAEELLRSVPAFLPAIGRAAIETARAMLDIDGGNRAALDRIPPPARGEVLPGGPALRPIDIRGVAYLRAGAAMQAIDEFQRILDHPGSAPESPLHALAHVQQGRAYVLAGESAKARKAYQDFLALWKDADPDVPILEQAKAEYARLMAPDRAAPRP